VAAIGATARAHGLRLHMDGARFANAVAHLGCTAPAASVAGGVDALSFGCVKNGGMSAEALVYFDPALAGNAPDAQAFGASAIQGALSGGADPGAAEGRPVAAQRACGQCGGFEIGGAAPSRLLHPVQANEVFLRLTAEEKRRPARRGLRFL
jgi:threonine aldolase